MFIIEDWAGNKCFDKRFKTVDNAASFLTLYIEKTYPDTKENEDRFDEEFGEYEITEE